VPVVEWLLLYSGPEISDTVSRGDVDNPERRRRRAVAQRLLATWWAICWAVRHQK